MKSIFFEVFSSVCVGGGVGVEGVVLIVVLSAIDREGKE